MNVGVIGLGGMGSGLAMSLLKAGHKVTVWNRSPEAAEALVRDGAVRADDPRDAFVGDAAVTMLSDDDAVRSVILDRGLLQGAAKGLVHVVSATLSVAFAKQLEAAHAEAGVAYLAAPVLGRPDVAEKGELNVIVAGAKADIDRAQPILDAIGKQSWPVGEQPHLANVAKLSANFMIAAAIETMAEAFTMAQKNGVDPSTLHELVTGTIFSAPVYKIYGKLIVDRAFEPAKFKLRLGLKDVRLAHAAGEAVDAPMPIASLLRDNFIDAIAHGAADKDWAALATVASRRAGLED